MLNKIHRSVRFIEFACSNKGRRAMQSCSSTSQNLMVTLSHLAKPLSANELAELVILHASRYVKTFARDLNHPAHTRNAQLLHINHDIASLLGSRRLSRLLRWIRHCGDNANGNRNRDRVRYAHTRCRRASRRTQHRDMYSFALSVTTIHTRFPCFSFPIPLVALLLFRRGTGFRGWRRGRRWSINLGDWFAFGNFRNCL